MNDRPRRINDANAPTKSMTVKLAGSSSSFGITRATIKVSKARKSTFARF